MFDGGKSHRCFYLPKNVAAINPLGKEEEKMESCRRYTKV